MSEERLSERLSADLKAAMRRGDETARDTIRYIMAGLKNAEIEKRGPLTPPEEVTFLQRQAKRMAESIDQFRAGNRTDLAEHEAAQLAILEQYLPASMSDEELENLVRAAIQETGATSAKDMGKVMPVVIERAGGRADGKRISALVRQALAG